MKKFEGRHIVILGASSVIARQTAHLLLAEGASLFLISRASPAETVAEFTSHTENIQCYQGDINDASFRQQVIAQLPPVQGFVCSIGVYSLKPAQFISDRDIIDTFGPTVFAPMLFVAGLLRSHKIVNGASLVFISSAITDYPRAGCSLYAASKGAVEAYVKNLAVELAPRRIRVNAVQPAFLESPMLEQTREMMGDNAIEELRKIHPLGFGSPADVARAIVFFLSADAQWITGTTLKMGIY